MGTAGYGGFLKPAVKQPGKGRFLCGTAAAALCGVEIDRRAWRWVAFDWAVSAGSTAGLALYPP